MSFEKDEITTLNSNPNSQCPARCAANGGTVEASKQGHSSAVKEHVEARDDPSKSC